ncbi:HNH endonuclease [Streptomyces qinglanensis]|uniref:HNH endonuclease n=1 Tax=Streptomyces qinglanensis TaxID=943816 RepID=A0A1H9U3V7_9ACTN|nr:HNH endonuclease domain-containing protein [Streptomyces qinglanensis]SES04002.1 HNH endonuclease [Streptomyces qinglanensis]
MTTPELPANDWRRTVYGRSQISGNDSRRRPRTAERARLIAEHRNRCLYCQIPIGAEILRENSFVTLRLNWDHFAPYAYIARNPQDNWVLACHVCNNIKQGRIFQTVQEVRNTILPERLTKGYEDPLSVCRRLGIVIDHDPWPDRLCVVKQATIHSAAPSKAGFWKTACGLEKPAVLWRTPAKATRYCADCAVAVSGATRADGQGVAS